jgi:hypothetical protein
LDRSRVATIVIITGDCIHKYQFTFEVQANVNVVNEIDYQQQHSHQEGHHHHHGGDL